MTSFRAWLEEKDQRCLVTGDGIVTAQRGDLVVVMIVKRWEDVSTAVAAITRLTAPVPIAAAQHDSIEPETP